MSWFYERGHLIDENAWRVSKDKEFYNLPGRDYNKCIDEYMRKTGAPKSVAQQAIGAQYKTVRKHSGVSDILQGVSKKVMGIAGHDNDYFKTNDIVTAEAFAHMFEAQFDDIRYKEVKKYFPDSLAYFEGASSWLVLKAF